MGFINLRLNWHAANSSIFPPQGTFATAARIQCAVLQGALDTSLPLDVLTQFWYTITTPEEAEKVGRAPI